MSWFLTADCIEGALQISSIKGVKGIFVVAREPCCAVRIFEVVIE